MVNYFYNIILKTDTCDLYSDVLTSIRKDYYLSKEKQKGKITQNSSGDTLYYEFSIEKDRPMKWRVSDEDTIISECKSLDDGKCCINYYGESGLYKAVTFSKFHTLLKVEYYNSNKSNMPYCTVEPRKSGNELCLLLTSSTLGVKPFVLYSMPNIEDDFILDMVNREFEDYSVVASTNEGVIKFLSDSELEEFEKFVDRAQAIKLTQTALPSYIDEEDAVLAQKLDPKDFNVKRNLSEIIDITQAEAFSYDNLEAEILNELDIDLDDVDIVSQDSEFEEDLDTKTEEIENILLLEDADESDYESEEQSVVEEVESHEVFEPAFEQAPDRYIESYSAKYLYYGELDENNLRSGFGRTATEDGRTAYEGEYLSNKRNGLGAYYYKDSRLCYYGEWKDNKREGLGIGVSSVDKSIHVGSFVDNKPQNEGARINSNGKVEFITKQLSSGVIVELSFDKDSITVKKFNEQGEIISENTSNLMYF